MKPASALYEVDPVFAFGDFSRHYAEMASLELPDEIPAAVREQFDAARHTFLYAWHSADLLPVAELQAYIAVETSLRLRLESIGEKVSDYWGLGRCAKAAIKNNLIAENEIQIPVGTGTIQAFDFICRLRDGLAHGKVHKLPQGTSLSLLVCKELITLLYKRG